MNRAHFERRLEMNSKARTLLALAMLLALPLAGCSSVGAGVGAGLGGYAGYELACDEDNSREECAAATGVGAIGGAAVGGALD
jgi:hypothetical protein